MRFKQIAQHLEGALIEVRYAAADVSQLLEFAPPVPRPAAGEALLFTLLAITRLLEDALIALRSPAPPS
jgi:hypothetical protein